MQEVFNLHHGEGRIKFKQEQTSLVDGIAAYITAVQAAYRKNFVLGWQ